VPAAWKRPQGAAAFRELARGYLLAPLISGLLIFLAGVGIVRKIRSKRHGWSDVHIPVVMKPHGYDEVVADLGLALDSAGLDAKAEEAPWVLTVPARLLTAVSSSNVRKLRPDRLIELRSPDLRVGVYPSDIAISGPVGGRTRARAAILSRLATTAAHQTTSSEAQALEDDILKVAESGRASSGTLGPSARSAFEEIDQKLLELDVPTDEWDILYRLRLQVERDLLAGAEPGTTFPGHESHAGGRDTPTRAESAKAEAAPNKADRGR